MTASQINFTERNWRNLLMDIEARQVIPIVGSELLVLKVSAGRSELLYSPERQWIQASSSSKSESIALIYPALVCALSVPWYGASLTARTVQQPKGRPSLGSPPFAWEDSAHDALKFDRLRRGP